MSYIRPLETDTLPQLNDNASARRIRAQEEELAAFRRGTHRAGYLKYCEYENGGGSITRRAVTELQEQVKVFREELRKKDAMIQHLVSLESAPKVSQSTEKFEVLYQGDKEALERARSDVAALQVKNERITQQLKESQEESETKEIKIKELETVLDSKRENEARLAEVIQSLRDRVGELEGQLGSYETVSNRGEYTISTLQRDLRESNDKVVELETRIKEMVEEQESWKQKLEKANERFVDLLSKLGALLNTSEEFSDISVSVDAVVEKVTYLQKENTSLLGKVGTLTESLSLTQVESRASHETIKRLASENSREQKLAIQYSADLEKVRAEMDEAVAVRGELERDVMLLREKLESVERLHASTKSELQLRETRLSSLELEFRQSSHSASSATAAFQLLREQLISILATVFEAVDGSDEGLKEAVTKLTVDAREYRPKLAEYESRVNSLTEQLEWQLGSQKELMLRTKQYETDIADLDNKLRAADGELAAGDVLREGFKVDKEKYLQGLQRLGEIMKMDHASLDLGLDMVLGALISRAEQLVNLEADALAERTTHLYSLKRRIKTLKEQLESKELHIDLLRKKVTSLEERVHGRVDLQNMVEAETLRVKKQERLIAKYKLQLTDARQEIQNLKAQLLGTTELKLHALEQRKDVAELANQVEELEGVRRQQATKITVLKDEVVTTESELKDKLVVADNAVQALSSELRTTKNAFDDSKFKEKQLLDFRGVVCRMLGLDMNSLAVPDYDIITRLEKLILAHHSTAVSTIGLQEALADAEEGFVDMAVVDPVVHRSRLRCRRREARARARARSVSPVLRVY